MMDAIPRMRKSRMRKMPIRNYDSGGWTIVNYDDAADDAVVTEQLTDASIETVRELIESGSDINEKYDEHDETMLHFAARTNWLRMVKFLIDNRADVDALDRYKGTPLGDAVLRGHMRIVQYLLESGADKGHVNGTGQTLVKIAIQNDLNDIARYIESFEYVQVKGVHCDC